MDDPFTLLSRDVYNRIKNLKLRLLTNYFASLSPYLVDGMVPVGDEEPLHLGAGLILTLFSTV